MPIELPRSSLLATALRGTVAVAMAGLCVEHGAGSLYPSLITLTCIMISVWLGVGAQAQASQLTANRATLVDAAILAFYIVHIASLRYAIYRANTWLYLVNLSIATALYFWIRVWFNGVEARPTIMSAVAWFGFGINVVNAVLFYAFYHRWRRLNFSHLVAFRYVVHWVGGSAPRDGAALLVGLLPVTYYYTFVVHKMKAGQWLAYLPMCMLLVVLGLTLSRGVYVATISFFVFVWLLRIDNVSSRLQALRKPIRNKTLTLACIVMMCIAQWYVKRIADLYNVHVQMRSVNGRYDTWRSFEPVIREHAVIGIGGYNAPLIHQLQDSVEKPHAWNTYSIVVQLLLNGGVFGTLCFACVILVSLYKPLKVLRQGVRADEVLDTAAILVAGIVAVMINDLTFASATESLPIMCVLWGLVAMSSAEDLRGRDGKTY